MLFSSLTFLFVFLPIVLLGYYLIPKTWKNNWLLLLSIVFFAWGGIPNTVLFLGSILINYFFTLKINAQSNKKNWLVVGLVFNTGILVAFKYLNFIIENIHFISQLFGSLHANQLPELSIALPLGISFYTFHQMSMLWDAYRSEEKQPFTFADSALYVAFFPQLIAGPIVRYKEIIQQIRSRKESMSLFSSGIEQFILGLGKKIILANGCAALADDVFSYHPHELTSSAAWLGIVAYTLQIYFDFSGYSDMAIGLGRMFGFELPMNFNAPYLARGIRDFWHRWHISLSNWFRDYVYIPLGGNRVPVRRMYVNLLIVFLLTGFWHGATWSFVFWGLFHGLFIVLERIYGEEAFNKLPRFPVWVYTILVVMIGWVFFRVEHFADAVDYVGVMFGFSSPTGMQATVFVDTEKATMLVLSALFALRFFILPSSNIWKKRAFWLEKTTLLRHVALLFLFLFCVAELTAGSYNPFIYFRF
jgi:alginate O-acetyltransferase complex protein AlgI